MCVCVCSKRMMLREYIYLAAVFGASGYIQKKNGTISYKQLTRQLTKDKERVKYCIAKRSNICLNINQSNISLLINGICRMPHQTGECDTRLFESWFGRRAVV